jgi:hypothetical protein
MNLGVVLQLQIQFGLEERTRNVLVYCICSLGYLPGVRWWLALYLFNWQEGIAFTHYVVMKWKFSYLNLQECCKYALPAHFSNQVRAPKCTMIYQRSVAQNISTIPYYGVKVLVLCIIHCTHYPCCMTKGSAGLANISFDSKLKFICENFSGGK